MIAMEIYDVNEEEVLITVQYDLSPSVGGRIFIQDVEHEVLDIIKVEDDLVRVNVRVV